MLRSAPPALVNDCVEVKPIHLTFASITPYVAPRDGASSWQPLRPPQRRRRAYRDVVVERQHGDALLVSVLSVLAG